MSAKNSDRYLVLAAIRRDAREQLDEDGAP